MSSSVRPWSLISSVCGACFRIDSSNGYEPDVCVACGSRFASGTPWLAVLMRLATHDDGSKTTIEHSLAPVGDWTSTDLERASSLVRTTLGIVSVPAKPSPQLPSALPISFVKTKTRIRPLTDDDSEGA